MIQPPIRIRILGPPGLEDAAGQPVGIPVGKPLALLIRLHHADSIPRADLAHLFWPDAPIERARQSLRQALWLLRKAVGDALFESEEPVELADGWITTDLDELEQLLDAGELNAAIELWEDAPLRQLELPSLPEWDRWTDLIRGQAERRFGSALLEGAVRVRAEGEPEQAMELLGHAVAIQGYRWEIWSEWLETALQLRDFDRADDALIRARIHFADDPDTLSELDVFAGRLQHLRRDSYESTSGAEDLSLEFVGRTREYSMLAQRFRRAASGRPRRALILGEAGIGKSRLAAQICRLAESEGARSVWVKAEDGEETLDWSFLADVVKKLSHLSGAAGIGLDSDRVLRTILPGLGGTGRNGSGRGNGDESGILGTPPSTAIAEAVHDLIAAVSEDAPLVLSLDDLQWADRKSCSVLVRVLRRLTREPVFTLIACRSGVGDPTLRRTLSLLEPDDGTGRVELAPLTPEEVREAVSLLADFTDPEEAGEALGRLHERSGGNPLFLVETLKELRDREVLAAPANESGGWLLHIERFPEDLPLPCSVRGLLELRLRDLPDEAHAVLCCLLSARGPTSPNELQARCELAPAEFTSAIQQLLGRGVLTWTRHDRLAFAHDEMRATVRGVLRPPNEYGQATRGGWTAWWRSSRGRVAAAAVLVLGFVAWGSAWAIGERPEPADEALLYGGGSLYLAYDDEVLEVVPDPGPPEDWKVRSVQSPSPHTARLRSIHLLPDGSFGWFYNRSTVEDPPWIEMHRLDGTSELLVRTEGDDFFGAMFPDGRSFLHLSEDLTAPSYRLILHRRQFDEPESTPILEAVSVRNPQTSPDGGRIALRVTDTLVVISPTGDRLGEFPIPWFSNHQWCGESILVTTREPSGSRLLEVDPTTGSISEAEPPGHPSGQFACSPDGSILGALTVVDGEIAALVLNRATGEMGQLPIDRHESAIVFWAGQPLTPVPNRLVLAERHLELPWGSTRQLTAHVELSDGSTREVDPEIWSDNPAVASVTESGVLYANSPGTTTVRARWGGWLDAEVPVQVTGEERVGTLFEDAFDSLSTERWVPIGFPTPTPVSTPDGSVLSLNGDGRHTDGIIQTTPTALPGGGVVEMEFRLLLTRRDRQDVQLCLIDGEPPPAEDRPVEWADLSLRQFVCVRYPWANLAEFDPTLAAWRNSLLPGLPIDVSAYLPSDDWIHIAIQMRSDGEVTFFTNGEFASRLLVRLRNAPDTRWRIGIFGHSVDTEAHVRNVALWPGLRYEVPE